MKNNQFSQISDDLLINSTIKETNGQLQRRRWCLSLSLSLSALADGEIITLNLVPTQIALGMLNSRY